ncbi:Ankyrin repeat domain-containing protein 55 [Mactra antiquata]
MYGDDDFTPAHEAASTGDLQLLIKVIKQDPGIIQQTDGDGFTPLAYAVSNRHSCIVKKLIKMGADVNIQDDNGRTCLSSAAYQGWSDGVVYLLRKGAQPDIVDKSGRTPLHAATYDTDTRSLLALLKRNSDEDQINVGDNERMTALHWASFHDRPDHVRQLLQHGANCTLTDIDGKTPLHWAAQNGSQFCCFVLIEKAPHLLTSIDNCGKTPVHLAAAAGHHTILHELACLAPSTSEAPDKDDRTPLHWAAATGKASCVRALLNLGVIRNPHDVDGFTPLEYATNAGHKECITLLQDKPGAKSSNKKSKKEDTNTKSGGFFKGLFSRKKTEQVKDEAPDEHIKLPDVVKHKQCLTADVKNETVALDKEISNLTKDTRVINDSHGIYSKSPSVFREVKDADDSKSVGLQGVSGKHGGLQVTRKLESLTISDKLSDALKKGAVAKKKKKHKKRKDEGGSGRKSHGLNDNSVNTSPVFHAHLTPLDATSLSTLTSPRYSPHSPGHSSRDSTSVRRNRDLSPIPSDRTNKDTDDKSRSNKARSPLDSDPNGNVPPPPFSISGKVILPDIRSGHLSPIVDLNKRNKSQVKDIKKFNDIALEEKRDRIYSKRGAGIYTPQDRGRHIEDSKF